MRWISKSQFYSSPLVVQKKRFTTKHEEKIWSGKEHRKNGFAVEKKEKN